MKRPLFKRFLTLATIITFATLNSVGQSATPAPVAQKSFSEFDMHAAVGKRKVFVISKDEGGASIIRSILKKHGFSVLDDRTNAELVFSFDYRRSIRWVFKPILGGINTRASEEIGESELRVYAANGSESLLVFLRERRSKLLGESVQHHAESLTKHFLKEFTRSEKQENPGKE